MSSVYPELITAIAPHFAGVFWVLLLLRLRASEQKVTLEMLFEGGRRRNFVSGFGLATASGSIQQQNAKASGRQTLSVPCPSSTTAPYPPTRFQHVFQLEVEVGIRLELELELGPMGCPGHWLECAVGALAFVIVVVLLSAFPSATPAFTCQTSRLTSGCHFDSLAQHSAACAGWQKHILMLLLLLLLLPHSCYSLSSISGAILLLLGLCNASAIVVFALPALRRRFRFASSFNLLQLLILPSPASHPGLLSLNVAMDYPPLIPTPHSSAHLPGHCTIAMRDMLEVNVLTFRTSVRGSYAASLNSAQLNSTQLNSTPIHSTPNFADD